METEPLVVLAIVDALLVALFFLFRVLPWSRPGPWRLIWLIAGMTSILVIAAELVALTTQGTALAIEHQIPLFGAIFALTTGCILIYLSGQRVTERALTLSETDELTQLGTPARSTCTSVTSRDAGGSSRSCTSTVDGLKQVNDHLGHGAGDGAPRRVATVLRASMRPRDQAARLGGDEFALLLLGTDAQAARRRRSGPCRPRGREHAIRARSPGGRPDRHRSRCLAVTRRPRRCARWTRRCTRRRRAAARGSRSPSANLPHSR